MHFFNNLTTLSKVNYGLSLLHMLGALTLLILAIVYKDRSFNFTINNRLLNSVSLTDSSKNISEYSIFSLNSRVLIYMCIAFLAITSAFHLFYALDLRGWYSRNARQGTMSLRWLEYGITATIMGIIIAVLSGVTNLTLIVVLGTVFIATMSTGLWFEQVFDVKFSFKSLIPLFIGFLLLAGYIYSVMISYFDQRKVLESQSKDIPKWITWVVIGTLGFYGIFGIVPVVRWATNWNPVWFEYAYLFLSAVAKFYLGAFLGYSLTQRTE